MDKSGRRPLVMVNLFAALNCEGWLEVCGIRTLMHNKSSCIHAGFRSWDILRLLCCCLCFLSQGKSFVKKMCTIFSINWVNACLYSKIRLYDLMDQDQSLLPEWVPILAFAGVLVSFLVQHTFASYNPPPPSQILVWPEILSFFESYCYQIYIAAFSIGLGSVPWVIMSEVCIIWHQEL